MNFFDKVNFFVSPSVLFVALYMDQPGVAGGVIAPKISRCRNTPHIGNAILVRLQPVFPFGYLRIGHGVTA